MAAWHSSRGPGGRTSSYASPGGRGWPGVYWVVRNFSVLCHVPVKPLAFFIYLCYDGGPYLVTALYVLTWYSIDLSIDRMSGFLFVENVRQRVITALVIMAADAGVCSEKRAGRARAFSWKNMRRHINACAAGNSGGKATTRRREWRRMFRIVAHRRGILSLSPVFPSLRFCLRLGSTLYSEQASGATWTRRKGGRMNVWSCRVTMPLLRMAHLYLCRASASYRISARMSNIMSVGLVWR